MKLKYYPVFILGALSVFISLASSAEALYVSNAKELVSAVKKAHAQNNITEIVIAEGIYTLGRRLQIKRNNLILRSTASDPELTILSGGSTLEESKAEILLDISGSNITVDGLTLQNVRRHLIQLRAETNSDNFTLANSVLRDAYEQLFKVSAGDTKHYSDNGVVMNSVFYYSEGIGPQYYIGGIDAHRAKGWKVKYNLFKDIASPADKVAEHAIHFWNDSRNNTVVGNTIINCDRGIGFGMRERDNQSIGGLIADNLIVHTNPEHPFADVGIILESSPYTKVTNNRVFLYGRYPNAIEYRFVGTHSVVITGNKTNRKIRARDGASGVVKNNVKVP